MVLVKSSSTFSLGFSLYNVINANSHSNQRSGN